MSTTTKRKIYPVELGKLAGEVEKARRLTGIKSRSALLRLAIERGLPVLVGQLGKAGA